MTSHAGERCGVGGVLALIRRTAIEAKADEFLVTRLVSHQQN